MPIPTTIFPFPANIEEPIIERVSYLTNIITARDGSEQRVQCRAVPNGRFAFSCAMLDAIDAQAANAILYGKQTNTIGVPMWQFMQRITAPASAGAFDIFVSTVDVPFVEGGYAIAWSSPYKWDIFEVLALSPTQIFFDPQIANSYTTADYVMPLLPAWFRPREEFDWHSLIVGSCRLEFEVDAFPVRNYGTDFSFAGGWFGFDALDEDLHMHPNRAGTIDEAITRRFSLLDNQTGVRASEIMAVAPNADRPYTWTCLSRAESRILYDFIHSRKGRAIPIWIPSYQHDLTLAANVSIGAGSISVPQTLGYPANFLNGSTNARRHLHLRNRIDTFSSARFYTRVGTSTPSGSNDVLTISPSANRTYNIADTMVSFLKLCRLASDEVEIVWKSREVCEAVIRVVETPNDTP